MLSAKAAWLDLLGGDRWWIRDGEHSLLARTPMGLPESEHDGLLSTDGGIQIFPGGPIIHGITAIDPVSGGRLDGLNQLPWGPRTARQRPQGDALDPSRWAPRNHWGDPLGILTAMGELAPVDGEGWMTGPEPAPSVYWLPPSLEGGLPPIGPRSTDLPLSEDPITEALVRSLLPGGLAPTPTLVLDTILAEERESLDIPPEIPLSWFTPER